MAEEKGSSRFLYFCAITINITSFMVGINFTWSSPSLPKLSGLIDPEENPLKIPLTEEEGSLIASLIGIGGMFSALPGGYMQDKLGRKKSILIGMVPMYCTFLIIAFAKEIWLFYLARILAGISIGTIYVILPNYLAEISTKYNRGALSCILVCSISLGNLAIYIIGPYLSIANAALITLIPITLFYILTLIYIPESPYYLISVNDFENAEKVLGRLRGRSILGIQNELNEMKTDVTKAFKNKVGICDLLKSKPLLKGLGMTFSLVSFQQFSGVNVILFYLQNIFEQANSTLPPHISSMLISFVQVISSFISPFLADRMGRRFLEYISGFGTSISLIIMGFFFYWKEIGGDTSDFSWLPVACLILFISTYVFGFASVHFILLGEIFPPNYKAIASILTITLSLTYTFITTAFFPQLQLMIGIAQSFWLFSIFCIISIFYTYFILPETKGKSFAEIQKMLYSN